MMTPKEMAEVREQLKKDIIDLDHQVYELESFYVEDTKEAVRLALVRETCSKGLRTMSVSRPPKFRRSPGS